MASLSANKENAVPLSPAKGISQPSPKTSLTYNAEKDIERYNRLIKTAKKMEKQNDYHEALERYSKALTIWERANPDTTPERLTKKIDWLKVVVCLF